MALTPRQPDPVREIIVHGAAVTTHRAACVIVLIVLLLALFSYAWALAFTICYILAVGARWLYRKSRM